MNWKHNNVNRMHSRPCSIRKTFILISTAVPCRPVNFCWPIKRSIESFCSLLHFPHVYLCCEMRYMECIQRTKSNPTKSTAEIHVTDSTAGCYVKLKHLILCSISFHAHCILAQTIGPVHCFAIFCFLFGCREMLSCSLFETLITSPCFASAPTVFE